MAAASLLVALLLALAGSSAHGTRWPSNIQALWSHGGAPNGHNSRRLGQASSAGTFCESKTYRKNLIKVLKTQRFISLINNFRGSKKFEASGLTSARGWLWVVFDNLHALGRVGINFQLNSPDNKLLGVMEKASQFEGLTYIKSSGHFLAIQELANSKANGMVPYTVEMETEEDDEGYKVLRRCPVHFPFTGKKGFEGIYVQEYANGTPLLLGLCEVVSKPGPPRHPDDQCGWDVVKVVDIPKTANFRDYSDIAFKGNQVAIVTLEDSAMYVGWFNWETLEFEPSKGETVYYFPRDKDCQMVWCTVEGVEWLDNKRLAIATDKVKVKQHIRCNDKDQSIAIVALPT